MATKAPDERPTAQREQELLEGLEGGPVVRMRADEMAPFGWGPLAVLAAVALIDRIETNMVAGVLPLLQDEWGFSDTLGGAIPFAAAIAALVLTFPAGYWADRHNRTKIIALVLLVWSIFTMASALAIGFWMLFVVRTFLGAADNIDNPSASSLIADYYPPRARARAYGYHRMAYYAGGSLGVFLGGLLGELFGWRIAFFSMVIPGLAVAGLCWIMREPVRGAIDRFVAGMGSGEISKQQAAEQAAAWVEEAESGETGAAEGFGWSGVVAQLRGIMAVKTVYFVYVGLLAIFTGIAGIFFWLPTYFTRYHDLGEAAGGGLTGLISLLGIVGGVYAGGWLGDRWHGVHKGGRILIGGTGLFVGSGVLALAFTMPVLFLNFIVLVAGFFCTSTAIPNLSASIADVLRGNQRGLGFALLTFLGTLGSAIGPFVIGLASDLFELRTAFWILLAPCMLGALVVIRARLTYDDDAEAVLEDARRQARA